MEKQTSRMSILKRKSLNQSTSSETMPPDTKEGRRVSFASSNFVKPFAADAEKNTIWDNTYEEEVNHTDSTKSNDGQECISLISISKRIKTNHVEGIHKENEPIFTDLNEKENVLKYDNISSILVTCIGQKNGKEIENSVNMEETCVDLKRKIHIFNSTEEQGKQVLDESMLFTCKYENAPIIENNAVYQQISSFKQSVTVEAQITSVAPTVDLKNKKGIKTIDEFVIGPTGTNQDIDTSMEFTCTFPSQSIISQKNLVDKEIPVNKKVFVSNMMPNVTQMDNNEMQITCIAPPEESTILPKEDVIMDYTTYNMDLTCNLMGNEIKKNLNVQDMEFTCNSTNICSPDIEINKNIEVQDMEFTCNSTNICTAENENIETEDMELTCKSTKMFSFKNKQKQDLDTQFNKENITPTSEVQKKCKSDTSNHNFLEDLTEQMVPYSCTNSPEVLNDDKSIIIPQQISMCDFNTGVKKFQVKDSLLTEHITESEKTSNKNVKNETKIEKQQTKLDVSKRKLDQTYLIKNQSIDAITAGSSNDVSSQPQFETFSKSENKCLKLPEELGFTNTPGASFALFLSDDTEEEQTAKRIYTTNPREAKESSKEYENLQKNESLVPLHKDLTKNDKNYLEGTTKNESLVPIHKDLTENDNYLFVTTPIEDTSTPLEDTTTPFELVETSINKSDLEEIVFKENPGSSILLPDLRHKKVEENVKDPDRFEFQKYRDVVDKCKTKFRRPVISEDLVRRWMETEAEIKLLGKLKLPKIKLLSLEELFNTDFESSTSSFSDGVSSTAESILEEDIVVSKSLEEKIQEAAKSSGIHWEFVRRENDCYLFYTLCQAVPFKVYVDPSFLIVQNVETFTNLLDNHLPTTLYETRCMQEKLKNEHLIHALGNKFDLLTLLDYVYMCMEDIMKFDKEYDELEADYLKSLNFRMNHDLSFTIEPCKINWLLWWIISVDLSVQNIGWKNSNEGIKAHHKADEPVPLEKIKEIARSIDGPHFIRNFIKKVNDFVNKEGMKIMMREPENKYRGIIFKRKSLK